MDKQAFFWKVMSGELPAPQAAQTLGIVFQHIDADAGTVELELHGKSEFTNPAGNIQGGFLAGELFQNGELIASATATAIVRSLPV